MSKTQQPQTPAAGIALRSDWGDARTYEVLCECGDSNHNHTVWIEAEDTGVTVSIYTQVKSRVWELSRWRKIWTLLTRGYVEYEANIILNTQQALNYAEALKTSVKDVESARLANK
jgi:hypothetical protein